ncbi:MAG: hypothetical protein K2K24_03015, partial [Clostridia bacterium]|nr:hypothetical protein [Clostridia bacterium]
VKIGGVWYLTDATWGNLLKSDSGYEFIAYEYFLFTDEVREVIDGYGKQNYTYYVADTEFDNKAYYSSRKIIINGHTADLYINSDTEMSYLLDYIDVLFRDRLNDLAGFSFEIMISSNVVISGGSADGSTASRLYYSALSILNERRIRGLQNRAKISVKDGFTYDFTNENEYVRAVYIF